MFSPFQSQAFGLEGWESGLIFVSLRPDLDTSISDWTDQGGGTTTIYNAIDETLAGDTDYIQSPSPPNTSTARFRLSNLTANKKLVDPVIVAYRYRKTTPDDQQMVVSLKQGTSLIASWTHAGTGMTETFQTVEQTLTAPQLAAINDFNDLFIEFQANPAWVPADAKVHIDFLGGAPQGRAWVAGTGEVALNTLLGSDSLVDTMWGGVSGYTSATLTADGYVSPVGKPTAFIGAALTKLLAGVTTRIIKKRLKLGLNMNHLVLMATSGSHGLELTIGATSVVGSSWQGSSGMPTGLGIINTVGAINGIASTITTTRFETTANGNTGFTPGTLTSVDGPPTNPFVSAMFADNDQVFALQSITLYDPLPSTTGLAALSVP